MQHLQHQRQLRKRHRQQRQRQHRKRQAQEALEEAAAAYEAGEIELKEYTAAGSALQYQRQVVNTIQEYQSKLSYAEQIRETTGQEIWQDSDRGYKEGRN